MMGGGYQQPIKESGIGSPWLAQGGGVIVFHQYDVIEVPIDSKSSLLFHVLK